MLFSYTNASEHVLPPRAKRFVEAAQRVPSPSGIILGHEALAAYLDTSGVGKEVERLIDAVTDAASQERVDAEVRRRVVTGRIPEEVAQAITEIVEVLGLHRQELTVAEIPLIAMLYTDVPLKEEAVVINITGTKQLADAVRLLWSRVYMSPYPRGSVKSGIAIFRMPPADATATVRLEQDGISVRAVRGWGRLVATNELCDVFRFSDDLRLVDLQVQNQDSMVMRNPRTGEVVRTTPPDSNAQKITDEQARQLAVDLRKSGESAAVFALSKERHWLLGFPVRSESAGAPSEDVPEQSAPDDVPSIAPAAATMDVPEEVSIEIVDLEESMDQAVAPTEPEVSHAEPSSESVFESDESEEQHESSRHVEPEVYDEPEVSIDDAEEFEDDESDEEPSSSADSLQQAQQYATALVEQALRTIELTMREWLQDDDQPSDFGDLVQRVSQKRQIPYKQRILSLHEMRRQEAFEEPSAEQVSFAFETMQRFVREF